MGGFFPFRANRLLMLISFIVRASAADCKGDFIVSSQQDADSKLTGCDTVIGSIVIASNYSGPFIVSSITNVTGSILMHSLYDPTALFLGGQNLTSLQADSVITMEEGDVRLVEVPQLSSVSMSSLQNVTAINVAFNSNGTLNFPALVNATDIHVFGSIADMNFTSLTNVSEQLLVSGITTPPNTDMSTIYNGFSYTSVYYEPYQGIDIFFPKLKSAMAIGLWGNISSISMPNLGALLVPDLGVSRADLPNGGSLVIQTFGNALDINLPSLADADGIRLEGTIASVELPSLYVVRGTYFINTTLDMNVNTFPLYFAGNITLLGHLKSINTSSIQEINSTETLASTYGIECSAPGVSPTWLAKNITLAIDGYAYKAIGQDGWTYICYPGVKFHRKKLYPVSTGGFVGIAVGIGVPLVLFIVWFVHRRGNKKIEREVEKRRQARMNSEFGGEDNYHELQERRHREAPPVYKEEGESTGTGGADSGVGVGVGGEQMPPGYRDVHTVAKDGE